MGAVASRINKATNAFIVEALAAFKALEFAAEMGFKCINLEGDTLQ